MMTTHRTAIIGDGAQIAENVEIGPYAVIGSNVRIGSGTKIGPHAVIDGVTTIGEDCKIFAGASIGLDPQDLGYKNEPTGVIIGNRVTVREYATIHRGTPPKETSGTEDGFTKVGDDCFIMNYAHVAHDCQLGKGVIMANGATLAGHVTVGDHAVLAGICVVHQWVRLGRLLMISGMSGTRVDLPPFVMCGGRQLRYRGINVVGMRRQKFSAEVRAAIKQAYKIIYRSELNISQALTEIEKEVAPVPEIKELVEFYRTSKRGVIGRLPPTDSDEDSDEG